MGTLSTEIVLVPQKNKNEIAEATMFWKRIFYSIFVVLKLSVLMVYELFFIIETFLLLFQESRTLDAISFSIV